MYPWRGKAGWVFQGAECAAGRAAAAGVERCGEFAARGVWVCDCGEVEADAGQLVAAAVCACGEGLGFFVDVGGQRDGQRRVNRLPGVLDQDVAADDERRGLADEWPFAVATVVGEGHPDLYLLVCVHGFRGVGRPCRSLDVRLSVAVDAGPLVGEYGVARALRVGYAGCFGGQFLIDPGRSGDGWLAGRCRVWARRICRIGRSSYVQWRRESSLRRRWGCRRR